VESAVSEKVSQRISVIDSSSDSESHSHNDNDEEKAQPSKHIEVINHGDHHHHH
jgi:hypothetical protein